MAQSRFENNSLCILSIIAKGKPCGHLTLSWNKVEYDSQGLTIPGSFISGHEKGVVSLKYREKPRVWLIRSVEGTCSPQCCVRRSSGWLSPRWYVSGEFFTPDFEEGHRYIAVINSCRRAEFFICYGEFF